MVGDRPVEYVFLKDVHPGIPDVEIIEKLLQPETILLTGDRVLHMQAIARRFRSYTLNEQGQLTRRLLPDVPTVSLPLSVHSELQPDYRYQAANSLPQRLQSGLTEKQFKRYRTARRRIRSYFGSAAAISQVSITVGSKRTPRGLLCGFIFNLGGSSGVPGLRASEGYCLPAADLSDPACPAIHALHDLYLLQLDQTTTEIFILPTDTLKSCNDLRHAPACASTPHETLRQLIQGVRKLTFQPCAKGRFFDAMNQKLDQLSHGQSNEVKTLDFGSIASRILNTQQIR